MSKLFRFTIFLCFLLMVLVGFIFASNNSTEVPLWIGTELAPQSLAVWVLLAFAWGGVLGLLLGFGLFRRIKAHLKIHQLEARLRKLQKGNLSASQAKKDLLRGRDR